jgi:hypothetical protein
MLWGSVGAGAVRGGVDRLELVVRCSSDVFHPKGLDDGCLSVNG